MRVFLTTLTFLLMFTIYGGALGDNIKEHAGDPGLASGIYCYDYYLLTNKGFDTSLFSGINPNASFMNPSDLLDYEVKDNCATYVVAEEADVNQPAPFVEENKEVDYSTDRTKILPDPGVMFVDEENIDFQKFNSGDTILYGGVLPFVALPDADLETEDSFFNEESFSLFLYFKTKF